jgi:hypothetical protein
VASITGLFAFQTFFVFFPASESVTLLLLDLAPELHLFPLSCIFRTLRHTSKLYLRLLLL